MSGTRARFDHENEQEENSYNRLVPRRSITFFLGKPNTGSAGDIQTGLSTKVRVATKRRAQSGLVQDKAIVVPARRLSTFSTPYLTAVVLRAALL